jgi:disulfide oxidoreductase YuzD
MAGCSKGTLYAGDSSGKDNTMNPVQQIKTFGACIYKSAKSAMHLYGKEADRVTKNFVKVRILDLPTIGCGCNPATCGLDSVTVKMMADTLQSALEEAYPGKTSTEYVNLLWTPQEQDSGFGKLLVTKKQPSPLIIIEDEIRYAGMFQVPVIVNEVGKILHF